MVASIGIQQAAGGSAEFSQGGDGRTFKAKHFGDAKDLNFYNLNEKRLAFTGTKDPVEIAWDHLDKQPISKLASMYVKENIQKPMKNLFKMG